MKRRSHAARISFFILLGIVAILFFGAIVMLLWNNVLAAVTNVHTITFLQALGLLLLSKILFGGFRGGGWGPRRHYWKQGMQQKWNTMTPEEREKFKQEWQKRCGGWGYRNWESGGQGSESVKENTETKM
jgi:Ca2+/H+ antiporter, TMEM165/GDT1 family